MLEASGIVRKAGKIVQEAADRTCGDLAEAAIEEPEFTTALVTRIADALNRVEYKGVRWKAKILTSRGPGTEEKSLGADFAGVLSVDLPGYKISKGFLSQAKLVGKGWALSRSELARTRAQCSKMLSCTPDSYLFLYNREGVWVVPASSVVAQSVGQPAELYGRKIGSFMELHFESFIGDRRISSPDPSALQALLANAAPSRVLSLELGVASNAELAAGSQLQ